MKQLLTLTVLLTVLTGVALADQWYSIDGFLLNTDDTIWIDSVSGGESDVLEFLFDEDLAPSARGFLVGPGLEMTGQTTALVTVLQEVHRITFGEEEITAVTVKRGPGVAQGTRLVTVRTTGDTWRAARIDLGATPGGVYTHLVLIALVPRDSSAILERLLDSLQVEITDAAG